MSWTDKSSVSYSKWDGEPNPFSSDQNCTAMWVNKHWRVVDCNEKMRFVCKRLVEGATRPENEPSIKDKVDALPPVITKKVDRRENWTPDRIDDFDFSEPETPEEPEEVDSPTGIVTPSQVEKILRDVIDLPVPQDAPMKSVIDAWTDPEQLAEEDAWQKA